MTHIYNDLLTNPTLDCVRQARKSLQAILEKSRCCQKQINSISLSFAEAATNIVRHNNPTKIDLLLRKVNDGWELELIDDGDAWQLPPNIQTDASLDFSWSESGRGCGLIEQLCDGVKYYRTRHNHVQMTWCSRQPVIKKRVLVVEDDRAQARLLKAYLDPEYEVTIQADGYLAAEFLNNNLVDLVLSDINMPQMNGFDFRRSLSTRTETATLPFVFLTSSAELEPSVAQLSVDRFLTKPIRKQELLNTLRQVLNRSEQLQQDYGQVINSEISAALKPSQIPNHLGWQFACAYRNCGKGGGDLSFNRIEPDSIHLVIGDVMGHDQAAKFFSYALSGLIRSLLTQLPSNATLPVQLLSALNQTLLADELLSRHTSLTCSAMTLDGHGRINLASAGHPEPLVIDRNGIRAIAANGVMPGLTADPKYQAVSYSVEYGERVAFYTDGLFESAPTEAGRKALKGAILNALESSFDLPLEQALEHTMATFDRNAIGEIDDTLLILVENTPSIQK